jgi:hypothetical protein
LSFGGAVILYAIPVGPLTMFSFILWLRLKLAGGFVGYYVLFALWVTGIIDWILKLTLPSHRNQLILGRAGVLFLPVGVVTVFSFILWLTWSKIDKPQPINRVSGSSVG